MGRTGRLKLRDPNKEILSSPMHCTSMNGHSSITNHESAHHGCDGGSGIHHGHCDLLSVQSAG